MGTIKDRAARYARRVTGWLSLRSAPGKPCPIEDCDEGIYYKEVKEAQQ